MRPIADRDIPSIVGIYNYYVMNTCVSFEEKALSEAELENRVRAVTKRYPWLVYEAGGVVTAYAYASAWKERSAYRYTAETSVYVDRAHIRKGLGSLLYGSLLSALKDTETHALIAVIALPNAGSVEFHEGFGYKKAAHFKEVGYKFGKWIDVGYWERMV